MTGLHTLGGMSVILDPPDANCEFEPARGSRSVVPSAMPRPRFMGHMLAAGVGRLSLALTADCATRSDPAPAEAGYGVSAQYYDIAAEATWRDKTSSQLKRSLEGFAPIGSDDRTWFLDVGAGTGLSTVAIVSALPWARVLAVEPDAAMRAGLMTRVVSTPVLRRQVSILPSGLFEAELPMRFGGMAMVGVVHHFSPADRERLWSLLAQRLMPGGRAVIEVQIPHNTSVPPTPYTAASLGDVDYDGWFRADPTGPETQRWQVLYRATRAGRVLDERLAIYTMHVASFNDLETELSALAMRSRRSGDFLIVEPA